MSEILSFDNLKDSIMPIVSQEQYDAFVANIIEIKGEKWVVAREVRDLYGVSRQLLHNWRKEGLLTTLELNPNTIMYKVSELLDLKTRRCKFIRPSDAHRLRMLVMAED